MGNSIGNQEGHAHREDSRKSPRLQATILENGPLSPKEATAVRLLAEGLSKKQIASRVNRSIKTIDAQLDAAYKKLGAHSATHAIGIAITRGIVGLSLICLLVGVLSGDKTIIRPRGPVRTARLATSARAKRETAECAGSGSTSDVAFDHFQVVSGGAGFGVVWSAGPDSLDLGFAGEGGPLGGRVAGIQQAVMT